MIRLALAGLHLLALGIGLGAVWSRARTASAPVDQATLRRLFAADSLWGVAAVLWIASGLWRLFGQTEKSIAYYLTNHVFFAKMALLGLILGLEVSPMITLIRWRIALAKGGAPADVASAPGRRRIAAISYLEAALVAVMVFVAVAMARGFGARG
jgi:putative membrane protein